MGAFALFSVLAFSAPAVGQSAGTTLDASITATTLRQSQHQWTIAKSVSRTALNLFRGDSASVTYTVTATDTGATEYAWLVGDVTVANVGGIATTDLAITVVASTVGTSAVTVASATVDVSSGPQLSPGQTGTYHYQVLVPNPVGGATYKATANITITDHSGSLGIPTGPDPSATAVMTSTVTPVNASVNVDDSNGQTFAFSGTGTRTYATTFACDRDAGQHVNTARIRETGASASATVSVACFALGVQASAQTRLTRTYAWSIAKTAGVPSVTLEPDGSSASVGYAVVLSSTSADSKWGASGTVTIANPAPVAAPLASIAAAVGATAAPVTCPATSVPANGSLTCTYDSPLGDATTRTVAATATLTNAPAGTTAFAASATADFGSAAVTSIDPTVTVSDSSPAGPRSLGSVSAGDPSSALTYSSAVGPYAKCGAYTFTNTATFTAPSGATGSASVSTPVTVKCYQLALAGTAATSLTRTYSWTIAKSASAPSLVLDPGGATAQLGYTVKVASTSADSAWAASGTITVSNPAPVSVSLNVSALAAGTGAAVVCGTDSTVSVPARGSVTCQWTASLGGAAGGTLAATASLADASAFDASTYSAPPAAFDFSGATVSLVDPSVSVSDSSPSGDRDLGTVAAGDAGTLAYSAQIGPYAACGPTSVVNTATLRTSTTGRTASARVTTPVTVTCYDLGVTDTSATSLTRTWSWTIAKAAANPAGVTLDPGATSSMDYTVTLGSTAVDGAWTASGSIVVANPAPVAASLSGIAATAGASAASVTCDAYSVPAHGSIACSWRSSLASGAPTSVVATASLADASAFAHASYSGSTLVDFSSATVTEVDRTATVSDASPAGTRAFGPYTAAATPTTISYTTRVGPYSACGAATFGNTATFTTSSGKTGSASAAIPVTITCYPLGVTGSATTSATRTYTWTIAKSAAAPTIALATGAKGSMDYTVTLGSTSQVGGWSAAGSIVITNGAPVPATLSSVSATAASGRASVSCATLAVPAGGSITCPWTLGLSSGANDTLAITVLLADASAFTAATFQASAAIDTSNASLTEVDRTVTVSDVSPAGTRSLGTVAAGQTAPIAYSLQIGPYNTCGSYTFSNTATLVASTTGATGRSSANVTVSVPCPTPTPSPTATPTPTPTPTATPTPAPTPTKTPKPTRTPSPTPSPTPTPTPTSTATPTPTPSPVAQACTYTIGYWKTHPSAMTPYLPVWLGTSGGSRSIKVATTDVAVAYLSMADSSNGIDKLYAQLLAAKLSIAAGADGSAVATTITSADTFLASNGDGAWKRLSDRSKEQVLGWASTLDQYNNGLIGPGHCPS